MNTRREMLRIIGLAPAAVAGAGSQLGALVASPAVQAAAALGAANMNAASGGLGAPQPSYGRLGAIIGKQVEQLRRQAEDEAFHIRTARINGVDADIEALRSVSRVNKVRKQMEREMEMSGLLRKANEMMWG